MAGRAVGVEFVPDDDGNAVAVPTLGMQPGERAAFGAREVGIDAGRILPVGSGPRWCAVARGDLGRLLGSTRLGRDRHVATRHHCNDDRQAQGASSRPTRRVRHPGSGHLEAATESGHQITSWSRHRSIIMSCAIRPCNRPRTESANSSANSVAWRQRPGPW